MKGARATVLAVVMWEAWRQDDGGNRYRMSVHHDRVDAVARVLAMEAGVVHKQMYWVEGPPGPGCGSHRDLYARLVRAGEAMATAERTLDEFLRAWWLVSRPVAGQTRLQPDTVAAMICVAATIDPPPLRPGWRTTSYGLADEPASYGDWEQVVLSQLADLADLAEVGPIDPYPRFGVDVPRPPGSRRATGSRWWNLDPKGYLAHGMAGSLGDGDEADGTRAAVSGRVIALTSDPGPGERPLSDLSWADLAQLAISGQEHE